MKVWALDQIKKNKDWMGEDIGVHFLFPKNLSL